MKQTLDQNEILIAEFNYAKEMAFQANEDRIRIYSFYIASIGTLIASGILVDFDNKDHAAIWSLVFLTLSFWGFISLLKLARLRIAWFEAAKVMNSIKDHYIESNSKLGEVFLWTNRTLPKQDKIWTVAFLTSLIIILFNTIFNVLAAEFTLIAFDSKVSILAGIIIALISLAIHLYIWFRMLRNI